MNKISGICNIIFIRLYASIVSFIATKTELRDRIFADLLKIFNITFSTIFSRLYGVDDIVLLSDFLSSNNLFSLQWLAFCGWILIYQREINMIIYFVYV